MKWYGDDGLLIDLTDADTANDAYVWPVAITLKQIVYVEGIVSSGSYADMDLTMTVYYTKIHTG